MKLPCAMPLLVSAFWFLGGFAGLATANQFFLDTFDDGNHRDGDPVTWERGDFDAQGDVVVDGDLRFVGVRGPSVVFPQQQYDDFTLRTQARVLTTESERPFVGIWGRSLSGGNSYWAGLRSSGELVLTLGVDRESVRQDVFQTDLDAVTEDVLMQMDFSGDLISFTAWRVNEAKPSPQLSFRDSTHSRGWIGPLASADGGTADIAIRWFEVAPVPEPSSAVIGLVGALGLFALWRRHS